MTLEIERNSLPRSYIATRWSVHDVIGRLERMYEGDPKADFISVPALDENEQSNFDYPHGVGFDTQYFWLCGILWMRSAGKPCL